MESRGGKEKKRKTTREEDRRWQRLPWPGPHTSSIETNDEETKSQGFSGKPNNQALGPPSFSMESNHLSSSTGRNQGPLLEKTVPHQSYCEQPDDQRALLRTKQLRTNTFPVLGSCGNAATCKSPGCHLAATWKPGSHLGSSKPPGRHLVSATWNLPRFHLLAVILITLLSSLVRPTVGGEDL